jgi:hypothetical protein
MVKDDLRWSWQSHADNEADLRAMYGSTAAIIYRMEGAPTHHGVSLLSI